VFALCCEFVVDRQTDCVVEKCVGIGGNNNDNLSVCSVGICTVGSRLVIANRRQTADRQTALCRNRRINPANNITNLYVHSCRLYGGIMKELVGGQ